MNHTIVVFRNNNHNATKCSVIDLTIIGLLDMKNINIRIITKYLGNYFNYHYGHKVVNGLDKLKNTVRRNSALSETIIYE